MSETSTSQFDQDTLNILDGLSSPKSQRSTILQLAGVGHKENYLSNVYAYFLDPKGDHQLGQLFLDTLYEVIERKNPFVQSDSIEVLREASAEDRKRIDLVVMDNAHCLIIESKVYARLTNDLQLYERFAELKKLDKTCLVLSRHKHQDLPHPYKSVTHAEWAHRVEEKVIHSELDTETAYTLNQFIRTIKQLTISNTMEPSINEYFTHSPVIAKAAKIQENAKRWIHGQIESYAAEKGWETNSRNDRFRHLYPDQHNAYFTLILEPLWDGQSNFLILLEVTDEIKAWLERESAQQLPPTSEIGANVQFSHKGLNRWRHTYFINSPFPGSAPSTFTTIVGQAIQILDQARYKILQGYQNSKGQV